MQLLLETYHDSPTNKRKNAHGKTKQHKQNDNLDSLNLFSVHYNFVLDVRQSYVLFLMRGASLITPFLRKPRNKKYIYIFFKQPFINEPQSYFDIVKHGNKPVVLQQRSPPAPISDDLNTKKNKQTHK